MTLPDQDSTPNSQLSAAPLWTVDDVAAYLQLAPETVRVMARSGEIPSMKLGKRLWRFQPDQIEAWLEKSRVTTYA